VREPTQTGGAIMTIPSTIKTNPKSTSFSLESQDFNSGTKIPDELTCSGSNVSPALEWMNVPESVKSFAIFMDDPDAPRGSFTHWLIANIPAKTTTLKKGISTATTLPNGSIQGKNDFNTAGYRGPCPPPGKAHNYVIHLYAIDNILPLSDSFTKSEFESALEGHVISEAKITGSFGR